MLMAHVRAQSQKEIFLMPSQTFDKSVVSLDLWADEGNEIWRWLSNTSTPDSVRFNVKLKSLRHDYYQHVKSIQFINTLHYRPSCILIGEIA